MGRCVHEADEKWGGESKGADEKWGGESVTHSHSVGDAKRDNGCKCLIGDYIDNFGGEKFFLREQLMAISTTCHMDLATSLGHCPWYFVKDCL